MIYATIISILLIILTCMYMLYVIEFTVLILMSGITAGICCFFANKHIANNSGIIRYLSAVGGIVGYFIGKIINYWFGI